MTPIEFTFVEDARQYQAFVVLNAPVRLRIKNGDPKGIVPLEIYALDQNGSDPYLVKRLTSPRPVMDQIISFAGYPISVMLTLGFSPSLAEYTPVYESGGSGSGGSSSDQVQEVVVKVEEQKQVNETQQKQIDENTRLHEENQKIDEQQQKDIDELKTPMSDDDIQTAWDSVFGTKTK